MTLCAEIQSVLERTYRPAGFNVEDCVVGPSRCRQLASLAGWSEPLDRGGLTFLRETDDSLHIAIYWAPEVIETLEQHHPHRVLNHHNIGALVAFIEEIVHGVHAGLAFREGRFGIASERFRCLMEVQAKVDTFWMLLRFIRLITNAPPQDDALNWVFDRMFRDERFDQTDAPLARRYRLANQLARNFVRRALDLPTSERVQVLRDRRHWTLNQIARWNRAV